MFINIPRHNLGGGPNELGAGNRQALLAEKNQGGNSKRNHGPLASEPSVRKPGAEQLRGAQSERPANLEIAPWDPSHVLRPFYETLRDRLITYFEAKNLTHKPKLVAVTACAEGSGVSTVAAGLAASLSETGEGNVLLVDMNQRHGAAHHFCKGDLACDLEDALKMETRSNALVYDNLYVVAETQKADNLPRLLPRVCDRQITLMPKPSIQGDFALPVVSVKIQCGSCLTQSTDSLPNEMLSWLNSSPLTVCGGALSAARFSQKSKTDVP